MIFRKTFSTKTGFSLENVLKPLAKSILIPLGLKSSASENDTAFHTKISGSVFRKLITSSEEMNDIIKK